MADYSDRVRDHVGHIRNVGPPSGTTHEGLSGVVSDGPYIKIYLRIEGGRIAQAGYHTYACPAAIACASEIVETVIGISTENAKALTAETLVEKLGGLPEGKLDRPELAITALRSAIENPVVDGQCRE